ncbi:hypothetical protein CH275_22250 [Rhodococcus sp. 06-235-1A]|uniref:WXG100 family type VII secretion target n=1 Tax=Rhodococcus sp. 06-235-1A TaxID=2022508 RepID=UPI000B9A9841|nr:hypothetical protein [Rhodococcus sp. 06-235-1A]OZC99226.1 hypothetical protein CH275_22250 [Rhodococcus sp. 06-235-1A]
MTPPLASLGQSPSIDEILDEHAAGLLHFERFLPLVARVPGSEGFVQYEQVCARYDEQRGLNLGALGNDADAVEAMAAVLRDQLEEQKQLRRVLQMRWHGEAGDAVQTYLSVEQQTADEFLQSIEDAHQTMSATVDVLRDVVTDKAELFGGLDVDAVDGKNVDQIDAILVASGIECVPVDRGSVFPRVASAFEELAERARSADVSDEFAAEVAELCRSWIHDQFVPRMKATCEAVIDVCTSTDTAVRECLALLGTVLGAAYDPDFGDLDERSWAIAPPAEDAASRPEFDGPSVPPAAAAVHAAPVTVGPTAISPPNAGGSSGAVGTGSSDPSTTGAGFGDEPSDPLDGLVDRVVAEIVGRVDEALDGAAPDDRGDDGGTASRSSESAGGSVEPENTAGERPESDQSPPAGQSPAVGQVSPPGQSLEAATDERGHLEAELEGHRARIALEHDGAVSIELETPGLGLRSFELRIGPFGLPEIVEVPGVVDDVNAQQTPIPALPPEPQQLPEPQQPPETQQPPEPQQPPETQQPPEPQQPPVPPSIEPQQPTEPSPAESASDDVSGQCLPESSEGEQPVGISDEQPAVEEPPAGQHPALADHPIPSVQPHEQAAGTGAGLSEAGTL